MRKWAYRQIRNEEPEDDVGSCLVQIVAALFVLGLVLKGLGVL